jgi:hypothetical protein
MDLIPEKAKINAYYYILKAIFYSEGINKESLCEARE